MFKKKKIEKKNKIVNSFVIFSLFFIFALFIMIMYFFKWINLNLFLKNNDLWKKVQINLIKTSTGEVNDSEKNDHYDNNDNNDNINILLLWRWWKLNDAPNLTDTIILASINKRTKTISMLSIPRDLYVDYWNWKKWKINQIYAVEKFKLKDNSKAIKILENKITQITWEKIDYYVNVDFQWFSAFIDAIWWVKITVKKTLVDPRFPDWHWWYRKLIIRKGTWLFDWDVALMYARSRHSTSDFDRSLRQQQIIEAVRKKLNEWWFFSKIYKIKKFYDVFKKYVDTNLTVIDILKIFNEVWNNKKYKILSFNINDSCFFWDPNCKMGWFLYAPQRDLYWGASVLLPNNAYLGNISDYKNIRKYSNLIFNYPEIYTEKLKINILNSTKVRWIAWDLATKLIKYWLNIPKLNSIWNIHYKDYKQTIIYYKQLAKNSYTLEFLKKIFWKDILTQKVDKLIKVRDNDVKIEIILGDNYKKIFKNLNNNL